ncbi:MAG: hypothetical protein WAM70_18650, partial [Pyrinomonadaceae bacterium]
MNKNPLTTTVIVFAIGDGYTVWQAFATRTIPVFTAIAWIQGVILLLLYLKESPYAGTYLFYSVVPLFPIYFGLQLAGITAPPTTNVVYLVAFAIYAIALPSLWKKKREYDRYVAAAQSAPA